MADKILNINDYRKEEKRDTPVEKENSYRTPYIHPDEMNADDIQIEDPMNFLTAEEKSEYIKAHQETIFNPKAVEDVQKELARQEQARETKASPVSAGSRSNNFDPDENPDDPFDQDTADDHFPQDDTSDEPEDSFKTNPPAKNSNGPFIQDDSEDNPDDDFDQTDTEDNPESEYQAEADFEEFEEENGSDTNNEFIMRLTKILAIVTAVMILIIALLFLKTKLFSSSNEDNADDEFAYTSDTAQTTSAAAEVSGTAVSTTTDLNLRTSPEKGNNVAMSVTKGTQMIYVGDESGWAKVYYNGNYYYCSKDYLSQ